MWQADLPSAVVKKIAKFCSISPSALIILWTEILAKNVVTIFSSHSAVFLFENCH